jgi:uncharacterized membrane protein
MQIPIHPIIVHFPLALAFLMPVLVLVVAIMMKKNKISNEGWLLIVGLQLVTTVTGYISLQTGESEESIVERVVDKKLIHEHEEAAEIFVGSTVVVLALSIAVYFLRTELQLYVQLGIAFIGLLSSYFAFNTGQLGGELIYEHGAASAYAQVIASPQEEPEGILPTPGENTSESANPINESLKTDENDYGNSDEEDEFDDDDSKQED